MRNVISRPIQALWGGKSQKVDAIAAIKTLLELVGEAAIVYDAGNNKVLDANSAFLVLSAYSLQEVINSPLEELLDPIDRKELANQGQVAAMLQLRKRPSLPVLVRLFTLDPGIQWSVIRITPQSNERMTSGEWQERIFRSLRLLPELIQSSDLFSTIERILTITHDLFDTHLVCVYHAEANFPELKKLVTIEEITCFPETLPSSDLIRLSTPTLWMPGKRMITDLHRSARMANLSYIASTPLGKDNGISGLFIVGGLDSQPPNILLSTIELLGAYAGMAFDNAIRSENLERREAAQAQQVVVQSSVFEYIQDGVLVLTPDLSVTDINPAAEIMFGYTNKEVQGKSVDNIVITPDRLVPALTSAGTGMNALNLDTMTLHRRNGQAFTADVKVIPVEKDNEITAINLIIRDISEHEQIRMQTRQLEQRALLGEFMGVFAHEVLNPINSISTGLQLLSRRLSAEDPNQELVTRMENDCIRLHHQMEALKNFAKPFEPLQEPVNLSQTLYRILERWRPRMERLNVKYVYQPEENLPLVKGDWRALEQVFTNLISNAIDAMRENGGILSVRTNVSDLVANRPQVEVTVSDNGPGIPDEIRDRIFEPFVTTKPMGTGLGLPISKRIVTAHRGNITVNSFPGGTVFHVYLPVCEDDPECQSQS
jgi:two-component system, NtrC family, sensor histidine kinase AtoS